MAQNNPFNISFGVAPEKYISRIAQTHEVTDDFRSVVPGSRVYIITGIRGSGKTVLMTEIAKELAEEKDWIVVDLNPERDMLQMLAAALSDAQGVKGKSLKKGVDVRAFGVGVTMEQGKKYTDVEIAIREMLAKLKKQKKKVLLTVDEVTNNKNIKAFAGAFQIMIREESPVCLLMTGLYDNIRSLQNEKSMTFLYRAPKVRLEPLNPTAIRTTYRDVFRIDDETAKEMALLTRGYSFAFQVLGFLFWKNGRDLLKKDKKSAFQNIIPLFDQYMEEYVYEKIWSEMSDVDQQIITEMVNNDLTNGTDIQKALDISPQYFYNYKKRLDQKGIVDTSRRGYITIQLPRFEDFVRRNVL